MTWMCIMLLVGLDAPGGHRVTAGPFQSEVVLDGRLSAAVAEKIFTPRTDNWRIQVKWMAPEGSAVAPGDVVVRFDNSGMVEKVDNLYDAILSKQDELRTKENEAESAADEQALQLETRRIDFEKAELDAGIPKGLISEHDYQERALALVKARQALEEAEKETAVKAKNYAGEMEILKLEIAQQTDEYQRQKGFLESLEVHTRTGGVVMYADMMWEDRKVQEGDTLNVGFEVMQIPDLDTMEVEAFVGETDLAVLKPGMTAFMRMDAYPEDVFTGTVLEVGNKGETRSMWGEAAWFRARLSLDRIDRERMRPGMSLQVAITAFQADDVLKVPISAAYLKDGAYWVRPQGGEPLRLDVLAMDAFQLAVARGGLLKEGMVLQ